MSVYEADAPAAYCVLVTVATAVPVVALAGYPLVSLLITTPAKSKSPGFVQFNVSFPSPFVMVKLPGADGAVASM